MKRSCTAGLAIAASLLLATNAAHAAFHLWKFSEFFSNADGSVQFIEMHNAFNNEQVVQGVEIRSLSTGKTFAFPANLPSSLTVNRRMLIATAGFGSLPGGVTPDYTLPSTSFFNPAGDTISFVAFDFTYDSRTFASMPTDGVNSLNYDPPSYALAPPRANSPTNFAGQTGSVNLAALSGDHNGDGVVDARDYVVWRKTGLGGAQGYTDWRANFGRQASAAAAGALTVPEPSSFVLALALVALGFSCACRTRRRWTCVR